MKALLFFVTACTLATPVLSQPGQPATSHSFLQHSTSVSLLDSSISYSMWSSVSNTWGNISKSIYYYNTFNKTDAEFIYSSISNTWRLTGIGKNYLYDAHHNLLEKTYEQLISNTWTDSRKFIYTYDSSDNELSELFMLYNNGTWVNNNLLTYTYSGNNQTSLTRQTWDVSTNSWKNVIKITSSYNTNDQIISTVTQNWISGAWVNDKRTLNYIYAGNDLTSVETEIWNTSTSSYDKDSKTSSTYDINHQRINSLTLIWNSGLASWEQYSKHDYAYDSNGNNSSVLFQYWNNPTSTWTNIYNSLYYYKSGAVGLNEKQIENALSIYPNPSADQVTVSCPENKGPSTLMVSDLSGKTVLRYEINQAGPFTIDIRILEAGMYFMELKYQQTSIKGKFIKN